MRIVRILAGGSNASPAPVSVALGNFDGVHIGHQSVIAAAKHTGDALGVPTAAAIFAPHPKLYFQPETAAFRLQSDAQRVRALAACGVDLLFEIQFDTALARLSDADFVERVLHRQIGARHVSVGFDYHYGHARAGDVAKLEAQGAAFGFGVSVVPPVTADGEKISSTAIRAALSDGELARVTSWLTRPFAIEGVVIDGFKRGRTIGVPTANMDLGAYARPRYGVYAVKARVGDRVHGGVANCGVKPTIDGDRAPLLETHLFDFDGDLYGTEIEVELRAFLRAEQKFDSFDALRTQIARDVSDARAALG